MTAESLAIGVDLGATKIASALVSPCGEVQAARQAFTHPEAGAEAVLDRLAAEIEALIRLAPGQVAGVGVGSPGLVDQAEGVIRNAVNLGWQEVHLVEGVQARLQQPLPIWVQKDANASALGELHFGAGQGCEDFVFFSIGSGLGGGVIANGELVVGAQGNAAELGHLSLDPRGRLCACGQRGCAETVVSGPGLVAVTRELLEREKAAPLWVGLQELTPIRILEAACQGEGIPLAAFNEMGRSLGSVMAACAAVLNPARFVVGGGLGLAAFNLLAPAARKELELRVTRSSYENLQIVPSRLVSSAVGATCLVWQRS